MYGAALWFIAAAVCFGQSNMCVAMPLPQRHRARLVATHAPFFVLVE